MELIKVMLVDDEILAIEDIENLLDWEKYGFKIVATTTSSQKAVKLFHTYYPDVVFLDIKMPVINGLELSDKFLKIDENIKIVLLTAYKDFKYAKKAVELGVSNYLVKHEISKETLKIQLKKIREELFNQHKKNKIIKKQFLKNILRNEDIKHWPLKSTVDFYYNSNNEYALLLIKEDKPYLLNYFSDEEIQLSQYIMIEKVSYQKNLFSIDLLDYRNKLIVLVSFKDIKSWQEKKRILYRAAISILTKLKKEKTGTTFSTVISKTFYNIKEMPSVFAEANSLIDNIIILDKSAFIYQGDYLEVSKKKNIEMDTLLANILNKKNIDKIIIELEKGLDIIASCSDSNVLREFINGLLKFIEKKREEYGLSSLQELYDNGYLNFNQYSLVELQDWFVQQFKELLNLRDPYFYNYSHKVQQAILFINNNYYLQITRKDIADNLGISEVYISQLFKKETEKTFLDYLTHYRIKMAKYLLLKSEKKVYEIAESVGYTSSQYFSQVFYKETGMNPLEFREEGAISD